MALALADLKRAVVVRPDDVEARMALAAALLSSTKDADAEADAEAAAKQLQRVLELDPDGLKAPNALLLLSQAFERLHRQRDAAAALSRYLQHHPDDGAAHGSLAELLQLGGFLDEALFHAERCAALSPDDPTKWLFAADLCTQKGLPTRAIFHLEQGRKRNLMDPRLLLAVRTIYTELGEEEKVAELGGQRSRPALVRQAQAICQEPLFAQAARDPRSIPGQALRALEEGRIAALRQILNRSKGTFDQAQALVNDENLFGVLLAELAFIDGDLTRAERLYLGIALSLAKVAKLDREASGALSSLYGLCLLRLGDLLLARGSLKEAVERYRAAQKERPKDPLVYRRLGDVLSLQEPTHTKEAIAAYETALALSPTPSDKAPLQERLVVLHVQSEKITETAMDGLTEDQVDPIGTQVRRTQKPAEVGRILVLGVVLAHPKGELAEPVPLFGIVNELQVVILPRSSGSAGEGSPTLTCTGLVGPELLDEAKTAMAFVRAHEYSLGISKLSLVDVHAHYVRPRNEGRSGGLAQVIALVSALRGKKVKEGLAASGSVSPFGEVHRVDGVREKLLAAYHAGVKTVMLPKACMRQVRSVPVEVLDHLEVLYVDSASQACTLALQEERDAT